MGQVACAARTTTGGVLRQFAEHCQREGYSDGSITKEALDGFLYGHHLRSSTIRRNELALRQLTEHAQTVGWDAYTPAARTRVRVSHQPPYVFTDEEVCHLFAAIDAQRMSSYSNKASVDPVLFRMLYDTGLRISEALKLAVSDVDTRAGTLRIRDWKNGAGRTIPITGRLAGTLDAYLTGAHPTAGDRDYVFYSRGPEGRSTRRPSTCGFVATWLMPASRTSPVARIHTRCVTGSRSRTYDAGLPPARTSR